MNKILIDKIKSREGIDTATHSGSYELVQKAVSYYAEFDLDKVNTKDLGMLYQFCLIKYGKTSRDDSINYSSLPRDHKNALLECNKKWADKDLTHKNGNCGIFGGGSKSLPHSTNEGASRFISLLVEISKMPDSNIDGIFKSVSRAFSTKMLGVKAGIASQILHLLKPNVFPILNRVGKTGYVDKLELTGFNSIDDIKAYAENARLIYNFREEYLPGVNFRTIDVVFWEYQEEESQDEPMASDFNCKIKDSMEMKGQNIILYGVPGSGKSHTIKYEIGKLIGLEESDSDEKFDAMYKELWKGKYIRRVVFHPDYTYSDFTGQILPKVEGGNVKYEFKPGPFTRILKEAVNDSENPYFLVIEEINRGNAAAIFGDIFQLLDRRNHESEYPVDSHEIGKVVHCIDDDTAEVPEIKIPKNLWLVATMNTSDQNVFTLDTAFQRRWNMRMIENRFDKERHDFIIEGTGKSWMEFAEAVNGLLEDSSAMTSEEKRLGAWFIQPDSADGKTVSKDYFASKVLKYLWDDAFKFSREDLFNIEKYKTLEKVIRAFKSVKGNNGFGNLLTIFLSTEVSETEKTDG